MPDICVKSLTLDAAILETEPNLLNNFFLLDGQIPSIESNLDFNEFFDLLWR